jgi:hypothetical protein
MAKTPQRTECGLTRLRGLGFEFGKPLLDDIEFHLQRFGLIFQVSFLHFRVHYGVRGRVRIPIGGPVPAIPSPAGKAGGLVPVPPPATAASKVAPSAETDPEEGVILSPVRLEDMSQAVTVAILATYFKKSVALLRISGLTPQRFLHRPIADNSPNSPLSWCRCPECLLAAQHLLCLKLPATR